MTAKKDSVISRFPILHKIEIVLGLFLFVFGFFFFKTEFRAPMR